MTDTIFLEGIVLRGRHGLYPEETALGQRFEVDAAVETDFAKVCASGHFHDAINYEVLYRAIEDVITGEPVTLLEILADRLARALLRVSDTISAVHVTIRKPEAPLPMNTGSVGVSCTRTRADLCA